MSKNIEAIILAGGKGARMGNYTEQTQKCLLPIDRKPVIGHILDSLTQAFDTVDVKIGVSYEADAVKAFVDTYKGANVSVTYVPHILGTEGYGIYSGMKDHIHGSFIAMPGDVIVDPSLLQGLAERFAQGDTDAVLSLAKDVNEVDTHGVGKVRGDTVTEL